MQFAQILFWLLLILWLILGTDWTDRTLRGIGGSLLQWILFALLGFATFGNPFGK